MPGRICKILSLLFVVWPQIILAGHCTVSQIAIIPGSWENTGTKTSYTLQVQDGGGTFCHVSQTLRFSLASSGPGTFTGQTGNALQLFISSNSANRNFYYDGHDGGDYVLTAKAGYGAADAWTELFITTYNTAAISNTEEEDTLATTTADTTTTDTITTTSSSNTIFSAHYSSSPIIRLNQPVDVVVGAGRDRLGSVGSPLEFKAEVNFDYTRNSIFKWNFGDGTERVGDMLNHTYEYPGEYVVVLNVSTPAGQAVARTNVKIIEPELGIVLVVPERIEIKNNSKYEISLFGRALVAGGKVFVFPQDTIIKAGQSISFSTKVTRLDLTGRSGAYLAVVGTEVRPQEVMAKMEEQRLEKIASIRDEIAALNQRRLALLQRQTPNPEAVTENENRPLVTEIEDVEDGDTGQTALVLDSVSETESGRMDNWLQTLKSFFLRTQ